MSPLIVFSQCKLANINITFWQFAEFLQGWWRLHRLDWCWLCPAASAAWWRQWAHFPSTRITPLWCGAGQARSSICTPDGKKPSARKVYSAMRGASVEGRVLGCSFLQSSWALTHRTSPRLFLRFYQAGCEGIGREFGADWREWYQIWVLFLPFWSNLSHI